MTQEPEQIIWLYGISRRDIPPTHQAIQGAHAQMEFVLKNSQLLSQLREQHPTFLWVTVADAWELAQLKAVLESWSINTVEFNDPDYHWGTFTAVAAVVPETHRHLLGHLPLWKPTPRIHNPLARFLGNFINKYFT